MPTITRVKDLRRAFWLEHEDLRMQHRAGQPAKTQNDYPADVRIAFVEYVDHLQRHGAITERLAQSATL